MFVLFSVHLFFGLGIWLIAWSEKPLKTLKKAILHIRHINIIFSQLLPNPTKRNSFGSLCIFLCFSTD